MLLYDLGVIPDSENIFAGHFTLPEKERDVFNNFGFDIKFVSLSDSTPKGILDKLKGNVDAHGSCLISVDGETGGHSMIIDHVSDDLSTVRIRDPYHGWEIEVKADALLKRIPSYTKENKYSTRLTTVFRLDLAGNNI